MEKRRGTLVCAHIGEKDEMINTVHRAPTVSELSRVSTPVGWKAVIIIHHRYVCEYHISQPLRALLNNPVSFSGMVPYQFLLVKSSPAKSDT